MLSDRSYMRDDFDRPRTSVLIWLVCAMIAGFLLEVVFSRALNSSAFAAFSQLSILGLAEWRLWTFLTFPFVDDSLLGLIFNSLSVYFLGRELLPLCGERRFLGLVGACAIGAGLSWFAVNHGHAGAALTGATSISCGLLILYACLNPDREITLLLFFILPVTVKPKYLAWFVGGFSLLGMLADEILGKRSLGIPHSAHVGAMTVALLYFVLVHRREWLNPDGRTSIQLPDWMKKKSVRAAAAAPAYKVNVSSRADLRAEVDRILDKINSEGFQSLTAEEKRILDEARDSLSRR
ncbi:rhomboid family intramembrane serine protease [Nibricoccus sp. IMCC34717]|uniref:rhomboid family intramembrane serine protease n=1 Tax=Nibricoccus sp. IMCC34717 TaxID=3034021 RepID=UPI00384E7513